MLIAERLRFLIHLYSISTLFIDIMFKLINIKNQKDERQVISCCPPYFLGKPDVKNIGMKAPLSRLLSLRGLEHYLRGEGDGYPN